MHPLKPNSSSHLDNGRAGLLILITFLVAFVVAVGVARGEDASNEDSGSAKAEPAATLVRELPAKRTATSDTFLLSDGSLEARLYETPVNYRDSEGDWKPIDQELQEAPNGAIINGANSFDLQLPEDLNNVPIRVDTGQEWVSEAPVGLQIFDASLDQDGTATYAAASGAAAFEYTGLANGLKESIVLADASAPSIFHFQVDASAGVVPSLEEDGSVAFLDQDGKLVAQMPAPVMVDAAEVRTPNAAVHYSLSEGAEGTWALTVEADPEWLRAEDRSWPVTIDPSVLPILPARDCAISSSAPETTYCAPAQTTLVAKAKYPSSGADEISRALVRFGLTSIPKTASLTAASVNLYSAKTATNVTKVDLYDVNQSWNESTTWQKAAAGTNWTTPGGVFGKEMPTPASVTSGSHES